VKVKKIVGTLFDKFLVVLQPPQRELSYVLQSLLNDSTQFVDLGCGEGNHLRSVRRPIGSRWTGVDTHQASLDIALRNQRYDDVVCENIISWLQSQPSASVDTLLASCVIEHLEKSTGQLLAEEMKRVCSRQAIIFTPNGFVPQPASPDNPSNAHRSGWSVTELNHLDFKVDIGLYGLRGLRTSFGLPTIKPAMLGDTIAKGTSRLVYTRPRIAYQIVGVHKKNFLHESTK
jgi:SAM-dependent methyltransferase